MTQRRHYLQDFGATQDWQLSRCPIRSPPRKGFMYRDVRQWRDIRRRILEKGIPKKRVSEATALAGLAAANRPSRPIADLRFLDRCCGHADIGMRWSPKGSVANDPSRTSVQLSVTAKGFIAERPHRAHGADPVPRPAMRCQQLKPFFNQNRSSCTNPVLKCRVFGRLFRLTVSLNL
jgi:hypothetical protein